MQNSCCPETSPGVRSIGLCKEAETVARERENYSDRGEKLSRVRCLREESEGKEAEGDPEQFLEFSGAN